MRARPPAVLVVATAVAVLVLALPLVALVVRAPWSDAGPVLTSAATLDALRVSLVAAVIAAVLAVLVGVPLAWTIARSELPGRGLLRVLALVPLVLPPVVGGVALLAAFGRRGVVGPWLEEWFGVTLAFTLPGVVLAELFVALPFVVVTVEAGLRQADARYEEAPIMAAASS